MSETRRTGQDGAQQAAGATIGRVDGLSIVQTAERLKAAAAAATPGPWEAWHDDTGGPFTGWPSISAVGQDASIIHRAGFKQEFWGDWSMREAKANAAHIATADPTTVTALADGVLALVGENERLKAQLAEARAEVGRLTAEVDAMLNRNGERIVASMLLTCLRCCKPFEREDDIYRCVDCGADLHRECAKDHFGTRVWPPTQACAVDEALRDERARAEQAERAAAHWQAEQGRVVEALKALRAFIGPFDDPQDGFSLECQGIIDAALAPTEAGPHTPASDTYVCPSCRRTVQRDWHLCRDDGHPYNTPAPADREER